MAILALILTLVGGLLVLINSPGHMTVIDGGTAETDFAAIGRKATRRNKLQRIGGIMALVGAGIQLAQILLQSCV